MDSVRKGETAKRRGDTQKDWQRKMTGYGPGRPKYHKSKGAGTSNSTAFIDMQHDARTKRNMN